MRDSSLIDSLSSSDLSKCTQQHPRFWSHPVLNQMEFKFSPLETFSSYIFVRQDLRGRKNSHLHLAFFVTPQCRLLFASFLTNFFITGFAGSTDPISTSNKWWWFAEYEIRISLHRKSPIFSSRNIKVKVYRNLNTRLWIWSIRKY